MLHKNISLQFLLTLLNTSFIWNIRTTWFSIPIHYMCGNGETISVPSTTKFRRQLSKLQYTYKFFSPLHQNTLPEPCCFRKRLILYVFIWHSLFIYELLFFDIHWEIQINLPGHFVKTPGFKSLKFVIHFTLQQPHIQLHLAWLIAVINIHIHTHIRWHDDLLAYVCIHIHPYIYTGPCTVRLCCVLSLQANTWVATKL